MSEMCRRCGQPFTEDEWLDRHSPRDDNDWSGTADVHARCCWECHEHEEQENS
jgi:hypothetical protein